MPRHSAAQERQAFGIPRLPLNVVDVYGNNIDLRGKKWITFENPEKRGRVIYNVDLFRNPQDLTKPLHYGRIQRRHSSLSPALINAIELFVVSRLKTHAPNGCRALFNGFVHIEKYIATIYRWGERNSHRFYASDLTYDFASSYNRWVRDTVPDHGKYVSFIKSFYIFGVTNGFPGFDPLTEKRIRSIQAASPLKGHIARFRDPLKGALIWEERIQVRKALDNDIGSAPDRAIAGLFYETGIRSAAAVRIRVKHLRYDEEMDYSELRVPRVKRIATNETRSYSISKQLAGLLASLTAHLGPEDFLLFWLGDIKPHKDILAALNRWASEAALTTLRLNDGVPTTLPLTPYRFRRTLATVLAEQGASAETIAEMLDDETLIMALIYSSNSSSIVEVLRDTLDRHPAWRHLIQLYLGRTATQPESAGLPAILGGLYHFTNADDYADRVGIIGWCALRKKCKLFPPLSCYRCEWFRSKRRVEPHELQLQQIQNEIEQLTGVESDRAVMLLKDDLFAIQSAIAEIREQLGKASVRTDPRLQRSKQIANTGLRH